MNMCRHFTPPFYQPTAATQRSMEYHYIEGIISLLLRGTRAQFHSSLRV